MFSKIWTKESMKNYWDNISRLRETLEQADAVVVETYLLESICRHTQ